MANQPTKGLIVPKKISHKFDLKYAYKHFREFDAPCLWYTLYFASDKLQKKSFTVKILMNVQYRFYFIGLVQP